MIQVRFCTVLTSSWHLNQVPVAAPWLVRAPIQKARPMIKTLAQSGKALCNFGVFWCSFTLFSIKVKSYENICYLSLLFLHVISVFSRWNSSNLLKKNNQWEKWQLISITIGFSRVVNIIVKWESVDSRETIWRESNVILARWDEI